MNDSDKGRKKAVTFLKKSNQKTPLNVGAGRYIATARRRESFFAAFFQKKKCVLGLSPFWRWQMKKTSFASKWCRRQPRL
jgi:hypothetical protein